MTKYLVIALILAALIGRCAIAIYDLDRERSAHEKTKEELKNWRDEAEACRDAVLAQVVAAEACLKREAQAQKDATARKAILRQAKTAAPSATEVVDYDTRAAVCTRLNRVLP